MAKTTSNHSDNGEPVANIKGPKFSNGDTRKRGIFITKAVQPETGAIFLHHCPICRKTVILANIWGSKPKDGDVWLMRGVCIDFPPHSMYLAISPEPYAAQSHRKDRGL